MTVQVRDLDANVQEKLREAAAREDMTLSAFLRRELTRLAAQLDAQARVDDLRARNRLGVPANFFDGLDLVAMVREDRDGR